MDTAHQWPGPRQTGEILALGAPAGMKDERSVDAELIECVAVEGTADRNVSPTP